jgi:hypothetical protein
MPESTLALYRDYLRGIWVLAAQKMYFDEAVFTIAPLAKLEQQLDNRFHQNFHTNSMTDAPAAHLLIPIRGRAPRGRPSMPWLLSRTAASISSG